MARDGFLGERLMVLRVKAGLSHEQLAEAANVSAEAIRDLEEGAATTPPPETLGRIADALGLAGPARADLLEKAANPDASGGTDTLARKPAIAGHAFLSYVREDSRRIDQLQQALQAAGIPVWRDTADLWPGEDWKAKVRQAIIDNALVFIACFSQASLSRSKSYQNEELSLAIEQFQLRRPDDPWIIPVRLDECDIPDRDIGGMRTLASIQRADLFADDSGVGTARLISAIRRILDRHDRTTPARYVNSPLPATTRSDTGPVQAANRSGLEQERRLSLPSIDQIVSAMISVDELTEATSLQGLIVLLPRDIRSAVRHAPQPRAQLIHLIRACESFPNGRATLTDALSLVVSSPAQLTHLLSVLDETWPP